MSNKRFAGSDMLWLLHFINLGFAIFVLVVGVLRGGQWQFSLLGFLSFGTVFFQFRWLIPCFVGGIHLGAIVFQPIVGGGSIESQIRADVVRIVSWAIAGLVIGLLLDSQRGR